MPATYEPIATTTLGSNTTQISFTSIPSTYTDLILIAHCGKKNNVANTINVRVNSDSGNNYSSTRLWDSGSGSSSDRFSGNSNIYTQTVVFNSVLSVMTFMFMNYSNTTTFKTMLARQSSPGITDGGSAASVGLWRSTSAITSIQLELDFGSTNQFITNSTFTLYGIKAA